MLQKTVGFSGFDSEVPMLKKNLQQEPRELMELNIEMMRESVNEPRNDSNACPPIATFAHRVVQKLLNLDNGARWKGVL